MAREPFPVEVLTPEGEVFTGDVEFVSTKTGVGSIGILKGHQPLLAMLEPARLVVELEGGEEREWAQAEGYLQVSGDEESRVLVLVGEAHAPDELDSDELKRKLDEAERRRDDAEEDSEAFKSAQRDVKRYETFYEIATGSS